MTCPTLIIPVLYSMGITTAALGKEQIQYVHCSTTISVILMIVTKGLVSKTQLLLLLLMSRHNYCVQPATSPLVTHAAAGLETSEWRPCSIAML